MLGNTANQKRGIDALYAQAFTLHFYALLHRLMVVRHSPTGTKLSTSVQSRRTDQQTIDGELIADATARLSISTIYDSSFFTAAASIIKLSFHGSGEAGTYAKECSISVHDGC